MIPVEWTSAAFLAAHALRIRGEALLDAGHSTIGAEVLREARSLHDLALSSLVNRMVVPA